MTKQPRRISGPTVSRGPPIINIKIDTRMSVNLQGLRRTRAELSAGKRVTRERVRAWPRVMHAVHAYRYSIINVKTVTRISSHAREFICVTAFYAIAIANLYTRTHANEEDRVFNSTILLLLRV